MSSTQQTLNIPELLDSILRHVPTRDLVINAQRVSRDWAATINYTPIIRQHGFRDQSTIVPEDARYQKNELAAFRIPDIFGVRYWLIRGRWGFRHEGPRDVSAMRLARTIRGKAQDWLNSQSKWRHLQVSLPSITKLRWEVTRLDRMDDALPDELPHAIAELNFPRGLRVGDLWDIISTTRGVHNVVWPTVRSQELHRPALVTDPVQQWRNVQDYQADSSFTLVLKQRVVDEDDYFEEDFDDTDREDEGYDNSDTHEDSLFQRLSLKTYFSLHNVQLLSLSVLEHAQPDAALNWTYTKVQDYPVRKLTTFAQFPFEPEI
ncbi:hypothetical protein F4776DRAFT_670672 [Hypoxylon sp. NC0597]|nr:hypothetical protein F4776DRAFT_670672 [Hypoxylon sp. NC0597]